MAKPYCDVGGHRPGWWQRQVGLEEEAGVGGLHNIFISHRHQDDALVTELKGLISSPRCRVRDFSVIAPLSLDTLADEQIMGILAPRIARAGKVLVIVHPSTRFHRWVDWEIEHAHTYRSKRIIGVWTPGASGCHLPGSLDRHARAVVEWNAEEVVAALEGRDNWPPDLPGRRCSDESADKSTPLLSNDADDAWSTSPEAQ